MVRDADFHRRAGLASEERSLRLLWRSVLLFNLREAAGFVIRSEGGTQHRALRVHQARAWIGSRGFREVCELAGVVLTAEEALRAVTGEAAERLRPRSRHAR